MPEFWIRKECAQRQDALRALDAYLRDVFPETCRLRKDEVGRYQNRNFTDGWRFGVEFSDAPRTLALLVDVDFPYHAPYIAVLDGSLSLHWPHIERDNLLCVLPSQVAVSSRDPVTVAERILGDACQLVEDCIRGHSTEDFKHEFLSYWSIAVDKSALDFLSLVEPTGPGRVVKVGRSKSSRIVGDHEAAVIRWIKRRGTAKPDRGYAIHDGVLLWLPEPLLPTEYPYTAADIRTLAAQRSPAGLRALETLIHAGHDSIDVLIGAAATHGNCFAGVILNRPSGSKVFGRSRKNTITHGFRPGRVDKKVLIGRYLSKGVKIMRSRTARVDHQWVHGRDRDPRQHTLRNTRVAILGCGSLGAPVARLLAQAGVGHFFLIDPQTLDWANISRHALGASAVGHRKASALAVQLEADFPHLGDIEYAITTWGRDQSELVGKLQQCNLIISTMGAWGAESLLNEYQRMTPDAPPVVYGWVESHAAAGHAVAVFQQGACFQCGFTVAGKPHLEVTTWPNEAGVHQEPVCGAFFTPYGPIELLPSHALIAELATDVILGQIATARHRVWVGRRSFVAAAGGAWADVWCRLVGDPGDGGLLVDRTWGTNTACSVCIDARCACSFIP